MAVVMVESEQESRGSGFLLSERSPCSVLDIIALPLQY